MRFFDLFEYTDAAAQKLVNQRGWLEAELKKAELAQDKARIVQLKGFLEKNSSDLYDLGVRHRTD